MKPVTPGRERMAMLKEGQPPDRPPVSFWRHFYTEENNPASLSDALLRFHRAFGWDWIKINPRGSYHLEDWGFLYEPSREPLAKPVKKHFPVQKVEDWQKITVRSATAGALAEHLDAASRVVRGASGDPVLMTVFSPLSIAGDLVPDEGLLLRHMREHPHEVKAALEAITSTFESFVEEMAGTGVDGIFFATTQWASSTRLDADAYAHWGRPFDLRVLGRASSLPFNLLHVCEAHALLQELSDYPVAFLNWGSGDPGNPDLAEGFRRTGKPVIGGLSRLHDLLDLAPDVLAEKVRHLVAQLEGVPWGCGPDCSIESSTSTERLWAVKSALESGKEMYLPRRERGGSL